MAIRSISNTSPKIKRSRFDKRYLFAVALAFVAAAALGFLAAQSTPESSAANTANFKAGDIISNEVMADYNSLTEAEIQSFLKSKAKCDQRPDASHVSNTQVGYFSESKPGTHHVVNGHFVCMADESFNGESAAHIIYQAAQDYKINPKVLIVVLQKEQGLVTDEWPNSIQYRSATGYGCPDTAACDSKYYGFKNQVRNAAYFFRYILDNGSRYYPVGNNYVRYNPNANCGGTTVNIINRATSALYQYTPYQPNRSALSAGYGTGDGCSAYGNRNFWLYYTDWFGDTHTTSAIAKIETNITAVYNKLGGASYLGAAKTGLQRNTATGIFWIQYEKGFVVGSANTGYFESRGAIRTLWQNTGFESGRFGFPRSNIQTNSKTGIVYQEYQKGFIVGTDKTGYFESRGGTRNTWAALGFEFGNLGLPTSNIIYNSQTGLYYQNYQNGCIVGTDKLGYYESRGPIRTFWQKTGFEYGMLGKPRSNIQTNSKTGIIYQQYEKGFIVGTDKTGYYESMGKIREYWASTGFESGWLGLPTSTTTYSNGVFTQKYQNGTVSYNERTNKISTTKN